MTGDERLAKVAEVLAGHRVNYHHRNVGGDTASTLRYTSCEGCDWLGGHRDEAGWERHLAQALGSLLDEFRAEDEARVLGAVKAVLDDSCHHCGSGPDRDGDHSCPCPSTDSECLAHLEYPVLPTNLRAALAAAEPDAGERPVDLTRLNYGICPKCGEDKFIGHGPWCIDCFTGGGA